MSLILGFALSLFWGMLFQQLYNIIDTAIVSWFIGKEAYTGVGTTGAINFLIMGFCMGVCNGFAIPVAQRFGARDYKSMRKFVSHAIILCCISLRWRMRAREFSILECWCESSKRSTDRVCERSFSLKTANAGMAARRQAATMVIIFLFLISLQA